LNEQGQTIADTLGETESGPVEQIGRTLELLGPERVQKLVEETLKIEAEGGMLVEGGERRRTTGGVFFKLVKGNTTPEERRAIFPHLQKAEVPPPPTLEEIQQAISEASQQKGEASTVKITITGRPGKIVEKGQVVITSLKSTKAPSLSKVLPKPPEDPMTYIVFIAKKQWDKVKDSIKNPDDKLIVDGYPVLDKRIGQSGTMTIYAQHVRSMLMEQAQREVRKAAAEES
jgi:hypothetical protein